VRGSPSSGKVRSHEICYSVIWVIILDSYILDCYRKAGKIAGKARDHGMTLIEQGARALDVVTRVEEHITTNGAGIAFPVTLSFNDVAAHYTPKHDDTLAFKKGVLVKIDVGAHVDGYIADTAVTVEVGGTSNHTMLREAVEDALDIAIGLMQPKAPLNLIGGGHRADHRIIWIQTHLESHGAQSQAVCAARRPQCSQYQGHDLGSGERR